MSLDRWFAAENQLGRLPQLRPQKPWRFITTAENISDYQAPEAASHSQRIQKLWKPFTHSLLWCGRVSWVRKDRKESLICRTQPPRRLLNREFISLALSRCLLSDVSFFQIKMVTLRTKEDLNSSEEIDWYDNVELIENDNHIKQNIYLLHFDKCKFDGENDPTNPFLKLKTITRFNEIISDMVI